MSSIVTRHRFDGEAVSDGAKSDAGKGGSGRKIGSSGIEGDGDAAHASAFFVTDSGFFLLPVTGAFRSLRIQPHKVADRCKRKPLLEQEVN